MSLFCCPECNKEISDKALFCPNCGYPISNNDEKHNTFYDVVNLGLHTTWGSTPENASELLRNICKTPSPMEIISKKLDRSIIVEQHNKIHNSPSVLISGLSSENAEYVKLLFSKYCKVEVVPSKTSDDNNSLVEDYKNKQNAPLSCPRCNSTSITTGTRGYSFFTGFLGSNKTVNRCGKCGYSWKP